MRLRPRLALLLLLAPAARADIPPAGRQECLDLLSGDPCGPRDDAGAPRGICRLVTCWQVAGDDGQGSPSPFTCLRCRPRDAPPEEEERRPGDRVLRVVQRGDDGPLREPALRRRRDEERREAARAIREAQERGLALGATLAGGSALVVAAVVLLLRRRGSAPAGS